MRTVCDHHSGNKNLWENVCLLALLGKSKGAKMVGLWSFFSFHVSHCRYWAAELRAFAQAETDTGFLWGTQANTERKTQRGLLLFPSRSSHPS